MNSYQEEPRFERLEAPTEERVVPIQNTIVNNIGLPDLMGGSSLPMVNGGGQNVQGKTIYAAELKSTKAQSTVKKTRATNVKKK